MHIDSSTAYTPLTCLTVTEESLACFDNAAPLPSACLGQLAAINCDANGQSCDYKASFAVQEDDRITITVSAMGRHWCL